MKIRALFFIVLLFQQLSVTSVNKNIFCKFIWISVELYCYYIIIVMKFNSLITVTTCTQTFMIHALV